MANQLKYVPKSRVEPISITRPNYSGWGAEWKGIENAAKGGMVLTKGVNDLRNHLNDIDDTQAATTALTDYDIAINEATLGLQQSGGDPSEYVEKWTKMEEKLAKQYGQVKFKSKENQLAFEAALKGRSVKNTINAQKKQDELRIDGVIMTHDENMRKLKTLAAQAPTMEDAMRLLEERGKPMYDEGVAMGVFDADKAVEAYNKDMWQVQRDYANEKIHLNPDSFLREAENKEAFFKRYTHLRDEDRIALRDTATGRSRQLRNEKIAWDKEQLQKAQADLYKNAITDNGKAVQMLDTDPRFNTMPYTTRMNIRNNLIANGGKVVKDKGYLANIVQRIRLGDTVEESEYMPHYMGKFDHKDLEMIDKEKTRMAENAGRINYYKKAYELAKQKTKGDPAKINAIMQTLDGAIDNKSNKLDAYNPRIMATVEEIIKKIDVPGFRDKSPMELFMEPKRKDQAERAGMYNFHLAGRGASKEETREAMAYCRDNSIAPNKQNLNDALTVIRANKKKGNE
jgi:hypothetical protein